MEQENNSFIHDTIDLEEIREMLNEPAARPAAEPKPEPEPAEQKDGKPEEDGKNKKKEQKAPGEELHGLLHDVVYILVAVTILFVFVVRLVGVDGESMLPTLHHMDFLLLESNFLYGADEIEDGDIVVLNVPYYEDKLLVKRVIATEGQTVDIDFDKGLVYVDGVLLQEDYVNAPTYNNRFEYVLEYPATVPEGCIFVLGDNRNDSMDSRFGLIGMIDTRCVLGKVRAIVLPGQNTDADGNVSDPRDWSRIGLVS